LRIHLVDGSLGDLLAQVHREHTIGERGDALDVVVDQ